MKYKKLPINSRIFIGYHCPDLSANSVRLSSDIDLKLFGEAPQPPIVRSFYSFIQKTGTVSTHIASCDNGFLSAFEFHCLKLVFFTVRPFD